jgi:hypothetical protein
MSSVFAGIERAEVFGRAQHIRPGLHRIRIDELLVKRSAKVKTSYFIVEGTIVSSVGGRPTTAKELPAGTKVPVSEPHQPGDKVSWIQDAAQTPFLSNVKGFALALAPGATEADITEASLLEMVNNDPSRGPVQPCAGILVDCDAFMTVTGKGGDFTAITWIAVDPSK